MGYNTTFNGQLSLSRQLTDVEKDYINLISNTRRMKRDSNKLMEIYQGKYGNPFAKEQTPEAIYGFFGEYFAKDDGDMGQSKDDSIIDYNSASGELGWSDISDKQRLELIAERKKRKLQPGLWCQWIIEYNELLWDGGEKFYNYTEWLEYLIQEFFEPWGVKLNGEIYWYGEESDNLGKIIVTDNVVEIKEGRIEYY